MLDMIKILSGLMPPDTDNPRQMRAYFRNNSMTLTVLVVAVSLIVWAMFSELPRMGGLAWAGDIDKKIDAKLDAAFASKLDPVKEQIKEVAEQQKRDGTKLNRLLIVSVRTDLCRYAARRMLERDLGERARLLDSIDIMKREFKEYAGRDFNPVEDC